MPSKRYRKYSKNMIEILFVLIIIKQTESNDGMIDGFKETHML